MNIEYVVLYKSMVKHTKKHYRTGRWDWKEKGRIKLAEDGQFDNNVKTIKKASNKIIEKYYNEYERKRMQKANEFITDQLISKFADALGGLDAIEKPEVLSDELRKNDLLKSDVIKVVENISPYIPFLGFLSGGMTMKRTKIKAKLNLLRFLWKLKDDL